MLFYVNRLLICGGILLKKLHFVPIFTVCVFVLCALSFPLGASAGENSVTVTSPNKTKFSVSIESDDITYALKAAFKYCEKNASPDNRCKITVAKGTYKVSKTVTFASYTTLSADGVTLINTPSSGNILKSPTGSGYSACTDFSMTGGTLTYSPDNLKGSCLVRIGHSQNITFSNVEFLNNYQSHHMEIAASKNVVVDSCKFSSQRASLNRTSAEALQIDILTESHFPGYEPYDFTVNDGITVNSCLFENTVRGLGTHSLFAGDYQKNIKITNNTFHNVSSTAVSAFGWVSSLIDSNTIISCGEGINYSLIKAEDEADTVSVSQNAVSDFPIDCKTVISNNVISVEKTAAARAPYAISVYGRDYSSSNNIGFKRADYSVYNIVIKFNNITTPCDFVLLSGVRNARVYSNKVQNNRKSVVSV